MKKVLFSAALLMAAATVSFAGNPKGETKAEAKTEVKAEAKTTHTYYVQSYNPVTDQYTLGPSPVGSCNGSISPCNIESEEELSSPIDADKVDNEQGLTIITRQAQL